MWHVRGDGSFFFFFSKLLFLFIKITLFHLLDISFILQQHLKLNMVALPLDEDFRSGKKKYILYGSIALAAVLVTLFSTNLFNYLKIALTPIPTESTLCPLQKPIAPESFYKDNSTVLEILHDKKYKKDSIKRLSGAIQIDTQIFDKQPEVDDAPEVWK